LARYIDERNDFFEHAGSVNEIVSAAKFTQDKKFVNSALKCPTSRQGMDSCLGNDSVLVERKHTLLNGKLPSLKTQASYQPDNQQLKCSKIKLNATMFEKARPSQYINSTKCEKKSTFWQQFFEDHKKPAVTEPPKISRLLRLALFRGITTQAPDVIGETIE
jgi:hypothetical protein